MVLNALPSEIFIDILIKTDGKTVANCRRVCKKWKNVIDNTDYLWEKLCYKEFQHPSKIAREKCHHACKWYHIYKNLTQWSHVTFFDLYVREFHEFPLHELTKVFRDHLRDSSNVNTPYPSLENNCPKIANNEHALVIFFKHTLGVVRPVEDMEFKTEKYFSADGFSLYRHKLFYYQRRDIYECDLLSQNLDVRCIHHCDYNIRELQHYDDQTFIFTSCGQIITLSKTNVSIKPINCPPQWIKQIKHICAINNKNYICYSRNLFKIETDKYRHLYLEFASRMTALFFYGDFVLIGTRTGEIFLYRLSDQKFASWPIFETVALLPEGEYAVLLDVCERKSGPVIIVTTLFKILLLEIDFFPGEKDDEMPLSIKRLQMYKRLLRIRDSLPTQMN